MLEMKRGKGVDLELRLGLNQKSEEGKKAETRAYRIQRLRQQRAEARVNGSHQPAHTLSRQLQGLTKRGNQAINPKALKLLLQKKLTQTDLRAAEVVLPKNAAEACLPNLRDKAGIYLNMLDMDYIHIWTLRYRYWYDRMYVLQPICDFVKLHNLGIGDFLIIYQDRQTNNYVIQGRKAEDMTKPSENDEGLNAEIGSTSELKVEFEEVKDNGSMGHAGTHFVTARKRTSNDCHSKKPLYSGSRDAVLEASGETKAAVVSQPIPCQVAADGDLVCEMNKRKKMKIVQ